MCTITTSVLAKCQLPVLYTAVTWQIKKKIKKQLFMNMKCLINPKGNFSVTATPSTSNHAQY